jgi:hypothetical protein
MKIELTNKKSKKTQPYPKLMIDDDDDIYFVSQDSVGTIIHSYVKDRLGIYIDDLNMSDLVDYEGKITLSND